MKKQFKIVKIIIYLFSLIILLSSFTYAESLSDQVFCIENPISKSLLITNKAGDIVLSSIDPEFESIEIVKDILNNKQTFLLKNYRGEDFTDKGEGSLTEIPSSRAVFYDLTGNEIGFEVEDFLKAGSIGDKILCSCIDKLVVFDTTTSEIKNYNLRSFAVCGKLIMIYDNSIRSEKKGILILDENLNEIKRYEDYTYGENIDDIKIEDISYKRIRRLIESATRQYKFNILNENGDKIFPEDFDNVIEFDKNIEKLLFGNVIFQYDFLNQTIISTPSIVSDEEREKIINDNSYSRFTQQANNLLEEILHPDEISKKIKSTLDASLYPSVHKWTYEDKTLYNATYQGILEVSTISTVNGIERDETYRFCYNIYDDFGNLLFENVDEINMMFSLKDYGYIGINGVIYDFDMNKIIDLDANDDVTIYKINNKTYFINNKKKYKFYFRKEKHNSISVFDDNFNILFSNLEDFKYMEKNKLVAMTDKNSTKFYDENFNLLVDVGKKVYLTNDYIDEYYKFIDSLSDRYGIINQNGIILISGLKNITYMAYDYFVYQNGFKFGIMDYSGNEIISFSIFDTFE